MISQQNKGRIVLVTIALMFFMPIFLSWYLNFFTDFKKNAEGVQHGVLIDPPINLDTMYGFSFGQDELKEIPKKWTLVFFTKEGCNVSCEEKLYQLRQIRLAVGKDRDKVERLLISKNSYDWEKYTTEFEGQKLIDSRSKSYEPIINLITSYPAFNMNAIYLIDAYGSLIMKYPENTEPKGIIKDIERLIRVAP